MRNQIGIDMLANWVSMLRADVDGAILLVDDNSEGQFYEKCSHKSARVVPSQSVAHQLIEHIKKRNVQGVVAAVSHPRPEPSLPDYVFQPSLGDIASLLLTSSCCEQSLIELGGSDWLKACDKEIGERTLIDQCILLAWTLETLCVAHHKILSASIALSSIDWKTLHLSEEYLASEFSPTALATAIILLKEGALKSRSNLLMECNGLIAVEILAAATRTFQPRGLQAIRQVMATELLGMMRLAFNLADFESDSIYWRMRAWERKNHKFPMLRKWRILDPLQVVLDQRYWETDLKMMLTHDATEAGMTAMKMDLDNFKNVNEVLGHSSGDEAIRLACKVLVSVFSTVAEIYRRGGDELVALAPGLRGPAATQLAESLREAIQDAFATWGIEKGLNPTPTASIGLVDIAPGTSCSEVIRLLDEAQSQAKQEGKNRVVSRQSHASNAHENYG